MNSANTAVKTKDYIGTGLHVPFWKSGDPKHGSTVKRQEFHPTFRAKNKWIPVKEH